MYIGGGNSPEEHRVIDSYLHIPLYHVCRVRACTRPVFRLRLHLFLAASASAVTPSTVLSRGPATRFAHAPGLSSGPASAACFSPPPPPPSPLSIFPRSLPPPTPPPPVVSWRMKSRRRLSPRARPYSPDNIAYQISGHCIFERL